MEVKATGEALRLWRSANRISQAEAGKLFGVSQRLISAWELGQTPKNFRERMVRAMAEHYAQPIAALDAYFAPDDAPVDKPLEHGMSTATKGQNAHGDAKGTGDKAQ